jgi:hypothetical protein
MTVSGILTWLHCSGGSQLRRDAERPVIKIPRLPGAKWFRVALGVFLFVAAMMKLVGSASGTPRHDSVLSPTIQAVAPQFELALAVFLVTGFAPRLTWLATLVFFVTAIVVNALSASEGDASCPCFGHVLSVDPRITLGLDILLLAGLVFWRPLDTTAAGASSGVLEWARLPAAVAFAAFLVVLVAGVVTFGSLTRVWGLLQGDYVYPDAYHKEIGILEAGTENLVRFSLTGISEQPVTIIGVQTNCGCAASCALANDESLPVTLAPGEAAELVLSVRSSPKSKTGLFQGWARVFLDPPAPHLLKLEFSGAVHSP